jgi:hypothetical protein
VNPWDGIIHLIVPGVPTVGIPVLTKIEETPVAPDDPIALDVPAVPTVDVGSGVYEMLGNCTISNAEPLVVTYAGHGLIEDDKIKLFNTMVLTITDSSCVEAAGTHALIFTLGGASVQATGTYTISGNTITAVSITTGGTGYTSAPTVATQTGDGAIVATLGDWRGSAVNSIYYNGSGSLPLPLASNTVYFVVYIDLDTFNLSLTIAGSPIDATTAGWGVHTLYMEA